MSFVAPVGSPNVPPPSVGITENTPSSQLQAILKGMSLTILGSAEKIESPGDVLIRLETPNGNPDDVPLNEALQQLEALGTLPTEPFVYRDAVKGLVAASTTLAQGIKGEQPMDANTVVEIATALEEQATVVERSIRDLIENSTYPNFSDFLKELVRVSQQLRELATNAKMAAIQANYEIMIAVADQMLVAAEQNKVSREKQIEADKKEAIGQIVGGALSLFSFINPALGQGMMTLATGSASASALTQKTESSTATFNADLANVAKQRLEAAAKLIEQRISIADDLREIAKGLRDMILKLYQDFIGSRNQVIQRANV